MKRNPLLVATAVFFIATLAELLLVSIVPGHFKAWYALPDRHIILMARLAMNVIIGLSAGLLVNSLQRNSELVRFQEEQKEMQEAFLNHHVRNALCSLQYAAYLTKDPEVIKQCEAAISRIVWALSNAHQIQATQPQPTWTQPISPNKEDAQMISDDDEKNRRSELQ